MEDSKLDNVPVKVIKRGEKQSVVEWSASSISIRVTIANGKIKDGYASPADLAKATPYGLDFVEILKDVIPDAMEVQEAFHNHGIWTVEDIRGNAPSVLAALSSIYSPILKTLMYYIKVKKL